MNIYCEYEKLITKSKKTNKFEIKKEKKSFKTTITKVRLKDKTIAKKFNKNEGIYTTIYCEEFDYLSNKYFKFISNLLTRELKNLLIDLKLDKNPFIKYFIVGLGNSDITADCLGIYTVNKIFSTTKDIESGILSKKDFGNVFSIAPSISTKTGVYTFEIVKSLTKELKPDIVILIDSLSCKKSENLLKTFQINTVGLTPGCDIGNKQPTIDKHSLSVPVLAIGCPTVINLKDINREYLEDKVLTIKDIDIAVKKCADIISFSLNKVIHSKLTDNEIIFLTKK